MSCGHPLKIGSTRNHCKQQDQQGGWTPLNWPPLMILRCLANASSRSHRYAARKCLGSQLRSLRGLAKWCCLAQLFHYSQRKVLSGWFAATVSLRHGKKMRSNDRKRTLKNTSSDLFSLSGCREIANDSGLWDLQSLTWTEEHSLVGRWIEWWWYLRWEVVSAIFGNFWCWRCVGCRWRGLFRLFTCDVGCKSIVPHYRQPFTCQLFKLLAGRGQNTWTQRERERVSERERESFLHVLSWAPPLQSTILFYILYFYWLSIVKSER